MELDTVTVEAIIGVCIAAITALVGFIFKIVRFMSKMETLMKDHLEESKVKDEQLDRVRLRLERMLGYQEGKAQTSKHTAKEDQI